MSGCFRIFTLVCLTLLPARLAEAQSSPIRPGHTIPLIDLAEQSHRQVIVDREKGQYLGHPTTVLLEDGKTIFIVYPKGHGRGPIVMKRSDDGGLTWSDRLPVPENWSTSKETPTIHRLIDPQGQNRLVLFSGLSPIRRAISGDDGQTWTPLEPIGDFGGIVAMASVERLKTGSYLALFHDDGRYLHPESGRDRFRVYKTISADGGLTWSQPEVIAEHPSAQLCEPGLIRSPNGRQLAVLLRENSRKFHSFVIFSDDEGRTWTRPRELPGSLTGDRHVGKYGTDGRLFVSFRDTLHESPTRGDWIGWVGTYDDIVAGREGQYRIRLMNNHKASDCAYPGLEVLPDGTFVATTYGHWTEGDPPYIVSVRFTLRELDELSKAKSTSTTKTDEVSGKIRLLIVEGVSNHDWRHRLGLVRQILARDGAFEVDVTVTPSKAGDPAWENWRPDFSKYDVVLSGYNNLGGKPGWPEPVRKSFEKFIHDGGGFYCYHEANNAFAEWPEYNRMIGLGWRGKSFGNAIIVEPDETLRFVAPGEGAGTGHGPRLDVTVHQIGMHPIHFGLPMSWMAADIEIYRYARGPAEHLTALAYAKDPQTKLQFPIEWTVQYGKGHVFVSTYGHVWYNQADPKGMHCAAFQTILVRALKWLAGRDPGKTTPPDFPTPNAISLRP